MKKFTLPRLHWFFYFLITLICCFWLYLFLAYGLAWILPVNKVANSTISGLVVRNQVWEGEIRIVGDVVTTPGTEVTLLPGTVVKIDPVGDRSNFDWLPWHLRSGVNTGDAYHGVNTGEPFWDERQKIQVHFSRLSAIGTKEQPITIQSASRSPSRYDVNVISVDHGVIAFTNLAHYRRLEIGYDVTVRDSLLREAGECALCIRGGSPSVINNIFEQALRESILVEGGSPRITNNLLLNLNGNGIVIDPQIVGTPEIVNNVFEMPGRDALVLSSGLDREPGEVKLNKFSGNSVVRIACDSQIYFSQNSILGQVGFVGSGCGGEYTFGPNFWGVLDARTIMQERILNKDREFTVIIPTVLTVPPIGVGRNE